MYSGFHHRQGTRKASTANKDLKGPRWRGYFSDSKADEAYKKTTRGYRRQKMREKRYGSGSSRLQRWQQLQHFAITTYYVCSPCLCVHPI